MRIGLQVVMAKRREKGRHDAVRDWFRNPNDTIGFVG